MRFFSSIFIFIFFYQFTALAGDSDLIIVGQLDAAELAQIRFLKRNVNDSQNNPRMRSPEIYQRVLDETLNKIKKQPKKYYMFNIPKGVKTSYFKCKVNGCIVQEGNLDVTCDGESRLVDVNSARVKCRDEKLCKDQLVRDRLIECGKYDVPEFEFLSYRHKKDTEGWKKPPSRRRSSGQN